MDPDAPWFVLKAVTTLSGIGALTGATYAFVKRLPPGAHALAMGINCTVAGVSFFTLREHVVSPILVNNVGSSQYTRRKEDMRPKRSNTFSPRPVTLNEIRENRLLDTSISGALAGAALYSWKRGRVGILPGAVTAAILSTTVQIAANEMSVARIKYVARATTPLSTSSSPNPTSDHPSNSGATEEFTLLSASSPNPDISSEPPRPLSFSEKLLDALSWIAPVKKLTDEEYLALMEKQRLELEKKLRTVNRELQAEQKAQLEGKSDQGASPGTS